MRDMALGRVKVLEYAQMVTGPYCTKLLADLGAEVIKIEEPGIGDGARRRGPFLNDIPHPERSGLFLYVNTNKMGITLRVETAMGKKVFRELAKEADILVEDKPPGMMKELGLDYESLREINQSLVMTSITPFGQMGPYKDYKAYHLNVVHASGSGYLHPTGSPNLEREPIKGGGLLDDYSSGATAAVGTLGALYVQRMMGKGQHVDVSKQEAVSSLDRVTFAQYPNEGVVPQRVPIRPGTRMLFPCQDGYVIAGGGFQDDQWETMKKFMGNPEWAEEEKFSDEDSRGEHIEELLSHLGEWLLPQYKDEFYHRGQAAGLSVAMTRTAEEVVDSQQFKARRFFVEIDHPETGRLKYPSVPYRFSETPYRVMRPAPLLGQHNEEIYCQRLGYSRQELVRMREAGII